VARRRGVGTLVRLTSTSGESRRVQVGPSSSSTDVEFLLSRETRFLYSGPKFGHVAIEYILLKHDLM
jgi:hypothetical protein